MKRSLVIPLLLLMVLHLLAEDITTTTGTTYSNVTINRAEPDGLVVMTDSGIEKIPFDILPKELQTKYGYDPQKAAKFKSAAQASAAQRQAEIATFQKNQQDQIAKEEAEKVKLASACRIEGHVLQVTKSGLLVESQALSTVGVGDSNSSIGGGGGVSGRHSKVVNRPTAPARPPEVYGSFLLVGHPKQNSKVDDDYFDVDAYEDGVFTYRTTTGASRTIKKYHVIRAVN